jgi:hypothetical protein
MMMDEEGDFDGEDQLVDDEGSPSVAPPLSHTSSNNQTTRDTSPPDHKPNSSARRRRPHDGSSAIHGPIDKSARKREQREREKEQQKQLLAKLIEIFGERLLPVFFLILHNHFSCLATCGHCFRTRPPLSLCPFSPDMCITATSANIVTGRGRRGHMCRPTRPKEVSMGRLTRCTHPNR